MIETRTVSPDGCLPARSVWRLFHLSVLRGTSVSCPTPEDWEREAAELITKWGFTLDELQACRMSDRDWGTGAPDF